MPARTSPKHSFDGLPQPLPPAAAAYAAGLPAGKFTGFPLTPLDRTGVPSWVVLYLPEEEGGRWKGAVPHGVGYGLNDADALVGAFGEVAELTHPTDAMIRAKRVTGSYSDLARRHGAGHVMDPLTGVLPAGSPVDRDTPLEWVEATRWNDRETVLVPMDLAALTYEELTPGYVPFTMLITNGLGAGPDLEFALAHGMLELLQRDGNGLGFRALDKGILLDLPDDLDADTRGLLDRYERAGIEVMPKFASDQFGLTNLYVVGRERDGVEPPNPLSLSGCGEACDPDPRKALRKALAEFGSSRARKAFSHGPLDGVRRVATKEYLDGFLARADACFRDDESRALTAMTAWATMSAAELRALLAPTVHAVRSHKPFAELPPAPPPGGPSRLDDLVGRLASAGLETLCVDMSPPGAEFAVARAIVPGLEVETMSYHRIGERGVAKLLAEDSPLIRFGAESETLRPVRLTPEALDRLGGRQPLLDIGLIDRMVDPLYPLYREPECHNVAVRLEGLFEDRRSAA